MIANLLEVGRLAPGPSLRTWRLVLFLTAFAALPIPCYAQDSPPETPDAPPGPLVALDRARDRVQTFFDQFSNVACTESVTQIVMGKNGKPAYRENSAYDYQFLATADGDAVKVSESRNTRNPSFRDPGRTLLITSGFASILLVVHPMYEGSYTFEPAGEESIQGVTLERIRFTPVAGTTSPAALRLRGKNYPLPLSGTLWIDPQNGVIARLEAQVDSSLSDLGLSGMRSEVRYVAHTFHGPEETVWIPESAVIDVETPHQHWRNLHRFTDYKRFNVDVHEEIGQNQ
jgi:hypothetical protein